MSNLVFLALLPGILIVIYIFRKDKVESEPVNLILRMVILGACSCAPAAFLEGIVDSVLPPFPNGSLPYAFTVAFFSAGLIEEVCKFAFLKVGIWKNREFDYRFDGIVYGVSTAIGFACLENVLYVMDGGISVAITRAFLSVPLHAFCGAFMGAYFGMAKYEYVKGNRSKASGLQIRGLILAIIIHGIYDTFAMWGFDFSFVLLLAFTAIIYVIGIKMINALEKDDWQMGFYNEGFEPPLEFVPSYSSPTVKNTNGMSVAGFICAIVSLLSGCVFILPEILAIVFGIIGLKRTERGGKNGLAKAAIIIGAISLILGGYVVGGYYY